jgi:hypothetical protein
MKARFVWMLVGLTFAVTLAIVVGQRLSAEAMAVIVGVVAGVAASIPTSLIVVWFATRSLAVRSAEPARPAPPPEPEQPRVVVMAPAQAGYPGLVNYPQMAGALYPPLPIPASAPFAPRQFNVIGGVDAMAAEAEPTAEVIWPR